MEVIGFICRCFGVILTKIILPTLLIVGVIIILNVIFQYIKYGKSVFSSFKKKDITDSRDKILYITLNKIEGYKKIIKLDDLNSNYVVIDKNGISLFYLYLNEGVITGLENDKTLLIKKESNKEISIENPFLKLNIDENKIKELIPDVIITKYLIILNNEYVKVKTNTKIINYNSFLYQFPKENNYNKNEINKFTEILLNNMSNNVKTIDKN